MPATYIRNLRAALEFRDHAIECRQPLTHEMPLVARAKKRSMSQRRQLHRLPRPKPFAAFERLRELRFIGKDRGERQEAAGHEHRAARQPPLRILPHIGTSRAPKLDRSLNRLIETFKIRPGLPTTFTCPASRSASMRPNCGGRAKNNRSKQMAGALNLIDHRQVHHSPRTIPMTVVGDRRAGARPTVWEWLRED